MAVTIRDPHLERRVTAVMKKRQQKTKAKAIRDLVLERLAQLEEPKRSPQG